MGNPILMIDPDGRSAEKVDNEYVKDKETGEVVMVGTKGGDETDYVYDGTIEKDGDGNVSTVKWSESNAEVLDVKTEYTSGPGTWQGEKGVATPGERSVHGKTHTDIAAYLVLADVFSGGGGSGAAKLGGTPSATYTFGQLRKALQKAYEKLGVKSLPKMKKGKFGSAQRGSSKKGVRLDTEGHPNTTNPNETGPHINWWDWTKGKKGRGGRHDATPIE